MKLNNKYILIFLGIILFLVVVTIIYKLTTTKQNYIKMSTNKRYMYSQTFLRSMEENKKILEKMVKQKAEAEKIRALKRKNNQQKALKARDIENIPEYPLTNQLSQKLQQRISECTLGRTYYLPALNMQDTKNFVKRDRRSIFKQVSQVGDFVDQEKERRKKFLS